MKIVPPAEGPSRLRVFFYALLLLLLCAGGTCALYFLSHSVPLPPLRITSSENAEILRAGTREWKPAAPASELFAGDEVRTGPFGRVDIFGPQYKLRVEEYSQFRILQPLRLTPFLRLQAHRGSLFLVSRGEKIRLTVPSAFIPRRISQDELLSDFLSFFNLTLNFGEVYLNVSQDSAAAAVSVQENTAEIFSKFGLRRFTAYENNKILFYQRYNEIDSSPLSNDEKSQLQMAFQKITRAGSFAAAPEKPQEAVSPQKIKAAEPSAAPAQQAKAQPAAKPTLPEVQQPQAKPFSTKSSTAKIRYVTAEEAGPYFSFSYALPNPDCVAGILFPPISNSGHPLEDKDWEDIKKLHFELGPEDTLALPAHLRIEIKSQDRVLRAIPVTLAAVKDWQTFEFPLPALGKGAVSEISLTLTYAKAGEAKTGGFRIRKLSFLP